MFNGQLNSNEIFAAIYNMIISQEVFADNIKDAKSSLVDNARVDGSLYGDTKLYYSTDVLESYPWGNDAEAANLLKIARPKGPKCQPITIDVFRQIALTLDQYMSKRAFSTEGAFASFNSVMLGWIRETKRIYDATTYNVFIGTHETNVGKQDQEITLPTDTNAEAENRLQAQTIAQKVADIIVDLEDVSREYNNYGHLRSYSADDFYYVWNAAYVNKINKLDLPTIFNKDFIDKLNKYNIPFSIADNDLHYISSGNCCCGDTLIKKSTNFNNTYLLKNNGLNYTLNDVKENLGCFEYCKCSQLFTSNRTEGCKTVGEFYEKRFDRKSSPFSPKFQYIENN